VTAPVIGVLVDLGAGTDSLHLANGGNSLLVGNVETITSGPGDDTIFLIAAASGPSSILAPARIAWRWRKAPIS